MEVIVKLTQFIDKHYNKYRYVKVSLKRIKRWLYRQKVSYLIYIFTIFVVLFGGFIFTKQIVTYIIIVLLLIAILWDLVSITLKYKTQTLGILLLFAFSIFIYFVNIQAESMAYTIITMTTGEKADYFPVANNFFQGIYIPLAIIMLIIKNLNFVAPIVAIVFIVSTIGISIKNKWRNFFIHLSLFISSILLLIILIAANIDKKYEDFFGDRYIPKKIIEYSYHKNTNCEGIDGYINFLYKDTISVTNVKDLDYSNSSVEPIFISSEDENITFSTQKCIRKKKVTRSM